ncbi:hypothetical protein Cgig2_014949 [Carnegiea gigantea]|uniref:Uncharacterized protein n=1 Tax=Carnegiea gigantea TaxID=171969 RepID=A0A9Q1JUH2_9CARY|nr:hypothetical protein Cgig2_014949 [Carnegiea gigantea]
MEQSIQFSDTKRSTSEEKLPKTLFLPQHKMQGKGRGHLQEWIQGFTDKMNMKVGLEGVILSLPKSSLNLKHNREICGVISLLICPTPLIHIISSFKVRLREIYDVLSDKEKRRFYDWTQAQEAASRQAEKMRMKLEDPYVEDVVNYESVLDMVDRLGGKNMKLSDQAVTAITFDVIVVIFTLCCIIYAAFFKEY